MVTLMEITMSNLLAEGDVDLSDFISRADALAATGHIVLISDYSEYYRLVAYLSRYTHREIAVVMGAGNVRELFDERYYESLEGGILESFGRLFKNEIKVFVYPTLDRETGAIRTVEHIEVADHLKHLYGYLLDRAHIVQLADHNVDLMHIQSPEVLRGIQCGDQIWETTVAPSVAIMIKENHLFGFQQVRGQ